MSVSTLETMRLIGIYRPRPHGPGFGIPVFSHSDEYWIQEVSPEGLVNRFLRSDVDESSLRAPPKEGKPVTQNVGNLAIYAFEATDGRIYLGNRKQVAHSLRSMLPNPQLTPFVLLDVAEFLKESSLTAQAQSKCDLLMRQTRKTVKEPR